MVLPPTTIRAGSIRRMDLFFMDLGMRTSDGDKQLDFRGIKRTKPCATFPTNPTELAVLNQLIVRNRWVNTLRTHVG
jgi:hypothetical protein